MPLAAPTERYALTEFSDAGDVNDQTSGSFTPVAGSLLIVASVTEMAVGPNTGNTISNTHAGSWSWQQATHSYDDNGSGDDSRLSIFYAIVPSSPGAGTVTVAFNEGRRKGLMGVWEVAGINTANPVLQTVAGAVTTTSTLTLTFGGAVSASSMVFGLCANAVSAPTNNNITPGTGFTELTEVITTDGFYDQDTMVQYNATPSANTCGWSNLSANATRPDRAGGVAIEIAASGISNVIAASEAVTLTENRVMNPVSFVTRSDVVTVTENRSVTATLFINKSETVTVSEFVTASTIAGGTSTIQESDTITVSESVSLFLTPLLINKSETVTVTSSHAEVVTSFITDSESITLTESVSVAASSLLTVTVSDTITVTESRTIAAQAPSLTPAVTVRARGTWSTVRFELQDKFGNEIDQLYPNADSPPTITNDTTRTIKRTLDGLELPPPEANKVNPLTDRVKVWWVDQDGEFPLGVFLFADASYQRRSYGLAMIASLVDQTLIFDQPRETTWTVNAGDGLSASFSALVYGVDPQMQPVISPSSQLALEPIAWPGGTSRMQIMTDLCKTLAFYPPFFNNDGIPYFLTTPSIDLLEADFIYEPENSYVYADTITESDDLLKAPNEFIVVSSSSQDVEIRGSYSVPPSAPHSLVNRGYAVISYSTQQGIETEGAANEAAAAAYLADESALRWVEFQTAPNPQHDTFNIIEFLDDLYRETSWSLVLTPGGPHTHSMRRIDRA